MDMISGWTRRSVADGGRRVARITALAALLACVVPAPARADFGAPVNLSNAAQDANSPHVAIDAGGNAVIVWYRLDGTYWRIQTRALSAAGELSPVQTLTSTGAHSILPRVAVNPGGNAVIVWQRNDDDSHYRIQMRARSSSRFLSPVLTLSEAGESAQNPQVAVDAGGNAVIVWYRAIGPHYRVQFRTRSAGVGPGLGPVETLSLAGQHSVNPEVAVDADGDALIVWRTHDGENYRIQLRPRSAAGVLGSVQTLSLAGQNAFSPKVAVDPDGNAVIVWHRNDGTNERIQARTRAADGTLGPVQNLSAAGQNASAPQIAVDRDGDAVIVWNRYDGTHDRIQTRTRSAADVLGPVQTLSEAGQNALSPTVAVRRAGGKAVAVWSLVDGAKNRVQAAAGP